MRLDYMRRTCWKGGLSSMTVGILDRSEKVEIPGGEEPVQLRCLICRGETRGREAMLRHLVARHKISKR